MINIIKNIKIGYTEGGEAKYQKGICITTAMKQPFGEELRYLCFQVIPNDTVIPTIKVWVLDSIIPDNLVIFPDTEPVQTNSIMNTGVEVAVNILKDLLMMSHNQIVDFIIEDKMECRKEKVKSIITSRCDIFVFKCCEWDLDGSIYIPVETIKEYMRVI